MLVIPAIDLRGGKAVRLREGDFDRQRTVADDPVQVALAYAADGARRLHVVDLDAARGDGENHALVARIVAESGLEVQVAGGIRDEASAGAWLEAGAAAVVLGTVAVRDPELFAACAGEFPGRVLAALDLKAGRPAVTGWSRTEPVAVETLLLRWSVQPLAGIVLTSVERDGTLLGPDLISLRGVREMTKLPLTYSGGVASLADLTAVAQAGADSVIVGLALYEGRIDLKAALSAV
jgi:phosphoribosylformimino-5-aminoimidazole carboxamide ribotide isomerase